MLLTNTYADGNYNILMTMVTYIYKSQWLVVYILFLMQNRKKIAGKQHIQKTMVIKIYH